MKYRGMEIQNQGAAGVKPGERILKQIAAIYVQTNGGYYGLPGVDPRDEARNAGRI